MTTQLDPQSAALLFNTMAHAELTDTGRGRGHGWSSEARLSMLALEISRYMPELAVSLARAGQSRMVA